jgi:hypothetical protein
MKNIGEKIADFDWQTVTGELNEKHMPWSRFLPGQSCDELISKYNNSDLYRKTSIMEKTSFWTRRIQTSNNN